jgi:LysM repeat protein
MPFGFDPGQYFNPATGKTENRRVGAGRKPPRGAQGHIPPPPGWVLLQSVSGRLGVIVELGDGSPTVTDGYATWQTIERPRRTSLTEWTGREPTRITFPVMIDGFADDGAGGGRRVERDCRELEQMAGMTAAGKPARLIFESGGVVEHDYTHANHLRWVIEALEWGDAIRNRKGRRIRQFADLTLMRYVAVSEGLANLPSLTKERKEPPTIVHTQEGDTLMRIAARYHLNKAEIKEAKEMNKIRDASAKLKKGTRVKLPNRSGVFGA